MSTTHLSCLRNIFYSFACCNWSPVFYFSFSFFIAPIRRIKKLSYLTSSLKEHSRQMIRTSREQDVACYQPDGVDRIPRYYLDAYISERGGGKR